jgi:hypothetical protein
MDHESIVRDYKRLRKASIGLNTALVKTLSRDDIGVAAGMIGMGTRDGLELETQDEMSVLMDVAIHDVFRDEKNAVERMLEEAPPPEGSDELLLLRSLRESIYSLMEVQEVIFGVGVRAVDMLTKNSMLVVDLGFSQTARPEMMLAARLYSPGPNWWMTTGAALPVNEEAAVELIGACVGYELLHGEMPSPHEFAGVAINACLGTGASHEVRYTPLGAVPLEEEVGPVLPIRVPKKVGRNDPCPCGSGRKYKKCCGGSGGRTSGIGVPRLADSEGS